MLRQIEGLPPSVLSGGASGAAQPDRTGGQDRGSESGEGSENELHGRLLGDGAPGVEMVGLPGIEPGTSSLSAMRSNRLSYSPVGRRTLSGGSIVRTRVVDHSLASHHARAVVQDGGDLGLAATDHETAHR